MRVQVTKVEVEIMDMAMEDNEDIKKEVKAQMVDKGEEKQ